METRMKTMHVEEVPNLILKIPGDIVDALRLPPAEVEDTLTKELALHCISVACFHQAKQVYLPGWGGWSSRNF